LVYPFNSVQKNVSITKALLEMIQSNDHVVPSAQLIGSAMIAAYPGILDSTIAMFTCQFVQ